VLFVTVASYCNHRYLSYLNICSMPCVTSPVVLFCRSCRCKMMFDFSDHIVLCVVQYILPVMLELHYSCTKALRDSSSAAVINGEKVTSYTAFLPTTVPTVVNFVFGLLIVLVCLRGMLLTSMFFHTRMENVVGLTIGATVAFVPFMCSKKIIDSWLSIILD
jgi:hypothetical protein